METPIRCLSSRLMSGLMTFRNSYGDEDNAPYGDEDNANNTHGNLNGLSSGQFFIKKLLVEFCFPLVTVVALVEKIVYTIFWTFSLLLYPISKKPKELMAKMVQSSNFTVLWSLVALYFNFKRHLPRNRIDLPTHESTSRFVANYPFKYKFFERGEDTTYVNNSWERRSFSKNETFKNQHQKVVVSLIVDNIFTEENYGDDLETKLGDFLDSGSEILMEVCAKLIELYVHGAHKENDIPTFFTSETQKGIQTLRNTSDDREKKIKGLASKELQTGSIVKEIFPEVNKVLAEKYPIL